jgi:hypothetical protein
VVANGCTLDGIPYTASFGGWDGITQPDGRVVVRVDPVVEEVRAFSDAAGSPSLRAVS